MAVECAKELMTSKNGESDGDDTIPAPAVVMCVFV